MNELSVYKSYGPFLNTQRTERRTEAVKERASRDSSSFSHDRPRPNLDLLISILEQEIHLHESLLAKKKEERPLLATGAMNALQSVTEEMSEQIRRIQSLEEQRQDEMSQWAEYLGTASSKITLKMISHMLPPDDAERLSFVGDRLRDLVLAVRKENIMNELLVRRSLRLLNEEVRVLIGGKEETASYSSTGGVVQQQRRSRSCIVDCRV
ncbi:MAG TPA: flagellar protein FlgN [bacterium]|nr:flagellar protein FlgN [bacterium]HQO35148.1 flagellar protein FlgN [bacterium]HQP97867.1 flagellar protein FlgN [bacterium]